MPYSPNSFTKQRSKPVFQTVALKIEQINTAFSNAYIRLILEHLHIITNQHSSIFMSM
jgi:hypothetical protein